MIVGDRLSQTHRTRFARTTREEYIIEVSLQITHNLVALKTWQVLNRKIYGTAEASIRVPNQGKFIMPLPQSPMAS